MYILSFQQLSCPSPVCGCGTCDEDVLGSLSSVQNFGNGQPTILSRDRYFNPHPRLFPCSVTVRSVARSETKCTVSKYLGSSRGYLQGTCRSYVDMRSSSQSYLLTGSVVCLSHRTSKSVQWGNNKNRKSKTHILEVAGKVLALSDLYNLLEMFTTCLSKNHTNIYLMFSAQYLHNTHITYKKLTGRHKVLTLPPDPSAPLLICDLAFTIVGRIIRRIIGLRLQWKHVVQTDLQSIGDIKHIKWKQNHTKSFERIWSFFWKDEFLLPLLLAWARSFSFRTFQLPHIGRSQGTQSCLEEVFYA